ncbi:MAG: aspartate semialdehyde dehydrogenase, partial [Dehalococcoidia bacterium]|nr:aspartate semialdehyde dehydrogenase [Dehalococcoidia bacterium]
MSPIKVGVLGATGMVGQRLVQLLDRHPWFIVTELAASERSSGKTYAGAMQGRWKLTTPIPEAMARLTVKECAPGLDCQMVFSALDADVAGPIEMAFAKAGYVVSSNARNYRMEPDVPLIIPEVNADHLGLIPQQKKNRGWKGFIVTDPNCTTIMLTLALKPLARFGLRTVMMTSMQALSGAGYPGVASLDSVDNVIPYIGGEEDKVESETLKLLGQIKDGKVEPAAIGVSAQCNRVNVTDGHTECVSVKLDQKVSRDDLARAIEEFNPLKGLGLPTAPSPPLILRPETDRPQPRLDRDLGKGMTVSVGRLRPCPVLDYKFVVMGHNTIRGAAGAAILNAELMKARGY